MGFNSAFKGLNRNKGIHVVTVINSEICYRAFIL